jgi:transposase InsO family protein
MCRLLEVSTAGYYRWRKECRATGARKKRTSELLKLIQAIASEHPDYGSPRIHQELLAHGHHCNIKTVANQMRAAGIAARRRRKFVTTTDSNHKLAVADNLLAREFTAEKPDQKWVGDTTFINTLAGWVYLTTILDLFSRKIVGWKISQTIDAELAVGALQMAMTLRQPVAGLIVHTDRGSQFCSHAFQDLIADNDARASMSRKGDCWDNAPMESFYRSLKAECVYWEKYVCQLHVQRSLNKWIEQYYNRSRRHSSLGYVSPVEFELSA